MKIIDFLFSLLSKRDKGSKIKTLDEYSGSELRQMSIFKLIESAEVSPKNKMNITEECSNTEKKTHCSFILLACSISNLIAINFHNWGSFSLKKF